MGRKHTILIADRNRNIRSLLERVIAANGYDVRAASTGRELLSILFGPDPVDLAVIDPYLPDTELSYLIGRLADRIPRPPLVIHGLCYYNYFTNIYDGIVFVEKSENSVETIKNLVDVILNTEKEKNDK